MINHLGVFCLRSLSLNSMRSNCLLSNLASVCVCAYLKHFISADTPQSKCVCVCEEGKVKVVRAQRILNCTRQCEKCCLLSGIYNTAHSVTKLRNVLAVICNRFSCN